jgi:predicted HTH transcriptional regulator
MQLHPIYGERVVTLPAWADPDASKRIPQLRSKGEGQNLDFKVEFPDPNDRLAQLVAGLASSGGGTILIGVENNGNVVGLSDQTEKIREDQVLKAQGVIRGVRPAVKFDVITAADEGKLILVIDVDSKQDHPVFYHDYRPYIRDGRMCRRAEPEEVQARVWEHPSAEHRRKLEELTIQSMKDHQEDMRQISAMDQRFIERMDVSRRALGGK